MRTVRNKITLLQARLITRLLPAAVNSSPRLASHGKERQERRHARRLRAAIKHSPLKPSSSCKRRRSLRRRFRQGRSPPPPLPSPPRVQRRRLRKPRGAAAALQTRATEESGARVGKSRTLKSARGRGEERVGDARRDDAALGWSQEAGVAGEGAGEVGS